MQSLSALGQNYVWRRGVECGFLTWFGDLPALWSPFATNINFAAQTTHWSQATDIGTVNIEVSWNLPMTLTTNAVDVPITVTMTAPSDYWSQSGWQGFSGYAYLQPTTSEGVVGYYSELLGEDWVNGNHVYHYRLLGTGAGVQQLPSLSLTNGMRIPEYRIADVVIRAFLYGNDNSCRVRYAYAMEPGEDSVSLTNVSPAPGQSLEQGSLQSFQADAVYLLQSADRGELQLRLYDDAGTVLASSAVNFIWRVVGDSTLPLHLPNGGTITVPTNTSKLVLKGLVHNIERAAIEYPVLPPEDRLSLANASPAPGQRIEQGARQAFRTDVTYSLRTRADADLELRLFTSSGLLFNSVRTISRDDGTHTVTMSIPTTGSVLLPWNMTNLFLQTVLIDRLSRQIIKESPVVEYTVIPTTPHTHFIFGAVTLTNLTGPPLSGVVVQLTGAAWQTQVTDAYGRVTFTNLGVGQYLVTPLTNGFPGIKFDPTNALIDLGNPTNHMNHAEFVATPRIVVLRALEAVQVIQNWSNQIPLIADKPTLVRAHLQLAGTSTVPIVVDGARLLVTDPDTSETESWLPVNHVTIQTNDCSGALSRSNLNSSLNFELPLELCFGRLDMRLEWTNGLLFGIEPAEPGGVASNCAIRVVFTNMPDLGVRLICVAWTNAVTNIIGGVPHITIITNLPTLEQLDEQRRRLLSIYPVARLERLEHGLFFWDSTANGSLATNEDRLVRLLNAAGLTYSHTNRSEDNRIWYGVVANQVLRGMGYISGYTAHGNISRSSFNYQRHLAAHEIGHTLGRPHSVHSSLGPWRDPTTGVAMPGTLTGKNREMAYTPVEDFPMEMTANNGLMPTLGPLTNDDLIIWGYDCNLLQTVSPFYAYELMSYCYGYNTTTISQWPWISKHTYTNLLVSIANRFTLPPPAPAPSPFMLTGAPGLTAYLLVRGEVGPSPNTVAWLPFYPVQRATPPATPTSGDYTLCVLNSLGGTLWEVPFDVELPLPEYDLIPKIAGFTIPVPLLPDMQGIVILLGGVPIASRVASANAPVIQGFQPNGGEVFDHRVIQASWFASDLDGDPLHFLVQFSRDGGLSWSTLAMDATAPTLDIPPETLAATSQGLLRVVVSDGFRYGIVESQDFFSIQNHAPIVTLVRPVSNGLFYGAQSIVFEASAIDLDDGPLSGGSVQWRSDHDGAMGSGEMLLREVATLSEGRHTISVTVSDSSGLTNVASVVIQVFHQTPPVLRIQRTNKQATITWPMALTNYVLESSQVLATNQWTRIANKPVATDTDQSVTVDTTGNPQFFRLRKP
jgi:hypothetical protein